jgi:hypothetical protein
VDKRVRAHKAEHQNYLSSRGFFTDDIPKVFTLPSFSKFSAKMLSYHTGQRTVAVCDMFLGNYGIKSRWHRDFSPLLGHYLYWSSSIRNSGGSDVRRRRQKRKGDNRYLLKLNIYSLGRLYIHHVFTTKNHISVICYEINVYTDNTTLAL